ncbi:CBS domain containing protein [Ammonifex degensii KC4]|uniref:CBS domain containing protein n=1 Tax=Ammonifex degensii (strain DSM 10501 / KC4) TaxID=429009 RepID=C9R7Y1_AMMDK|nr:CBS domain-containing protein [Ammonifex degensii]ACX52410.1 CBS domain containing protein [Ammonifex degensii KC4]
MEVITTHQMTDFDGLAAMVAASKLYPGARMVLPGKAAPGVEAFLALHKDALGIEEARGLKFGEVRRLILVDTRNARRLGSLAKLFNSPGLEIHIYDHHPAAEGDVRGSKEVVAMVGAATTLLVEEIEREKIPLSPFEATVLLLGIYEDTGSLLFPCTTVRDLRAVTFLLEKGGNLGIVANFLGRPLTEEQKRLFKALLLNAERHSINGLKVLLSKAKVGEFIEGLALLTHRLAEIERPDVAFVIVEMEDRVYVVGRAASPEIDVGEILRSLGGGGHAQAASAAIKGADPEEIKLKLLAWLNQQLRPPLTVGEIMTSPVKTVTPETSVAEAGQIMLRYGHSGLPVVEGGRLVGIISRRDVEKAKLSGLEHAPVKGYMSRQVVTVSPQVPVREAQALLVQHDIGRLPVVEGDRLVGIVSRTDILKTLHRDFRPAFSYLFLPLSPLGQRWDARTVLRKHLPPAVLCFLEEAGRLAEKAGMEIYLVGESVRDLLLGRERLVYHLAADGEVEKLYEELGKSAQVEDGRLCLEERFCFYLRQLKPSFLEYDATGNPLPNSLLRQELYQQDFTIDALAIALTPHRFGVLIDFFGGQNDLKNGLLRVLHSYSFRENPLRILRILRLAAELNFLIERETARFLREALREGKLEQVPGEKLWEEIKLGLEGPNVPLFLSRLAEMGVWPRLFPGLDYGRASSLAVALERELAESGSKKKWLCFLLAFCYLAGEEKAAEFCRRYALEAELTDKIKAFLRYPSGDLLPTESRWLKRVLDVTS